MTPVMRIGSTPVPDPESATIVKFLSVESNAYTRCRAPAPTITCPSDVARTVMA